MVSVLVDELRPRRVGFRRLVLGPHEALRYTHHGHQRQRVGSDSKFSGRDQRERQLRVEGILGELDAERGQLGLVVERTNVVEELEGAHEGLGRGRGNKVEMDEIFDSQLFHRQHDRCEIRPQNLRVSGRLECFETALRVESETLARLRSAGAARALLRRRLRDRRRQQGLNLGARIVHLLLGEARVNDVHDAVNGERGLGNVGRNDAFSAHRTSFEPRRRRGFEDPLLHLRR